MTADKLIQICWHMTLEKSIAVYIDPENYIFLPGSSVPYVHAWYIHVLYSIELVLQLNSHKSVNLTLSAIYTKEGSLKLCFEAKQSEAKFKPICSFFSFFFTFFRFFLFFSLFFTFFSLNFRFASIFSLNFRLFYLRFRFWFLVFRIEVNHVKSGFFFASKRNEIFASISNFASEAKVRAHPNYDARMSRICDICTRETPRRNVVVNIEPYEENFIFRCWRVNCFAYIILIY